jgi:hypothetical protein
MAADDDLATIEMVDAFDTRGRGGGLSIGLARAGTRETLLLEQRRALTTVTGGEGSIYRGID